MLMPIAFWTMLYFVVGLLFVVLVKPTRTYENKMGDVPPAVWFFIWPFALFVVGLVQGGFRLNKLLEGLHGALRNK